MKIAGIAILYYPNHKELVHNIKSYAPYLTKLYLFDNSFDQFRENEVDLSKIKKEIDLTEVEYLSYNSNVGLSIAINEGLKRSLSEGYDFLLTMDQDSSFSKSGAQLFFEDFRSIDKSKLGIFSPLHGNLSLKSYQIAGITYLTMTSGNILSVKISDKLNLFDQDFFIDHIDHYSCLKLQENGYRIHFSNVRINHELGKKKSLFGIKYVYHSPLRFYYFVRNGLFTQKRFPVFRKYFFKRMVTDFVRLIIFDFQFIDTFKYTFYGIRDYLVGKKGKYNL